MDKETDPYLVIPEPDQQLLAECRVETFRAGGPGGQHQNTTESGVRLVHLPSGLRAVAREERSQHRNRAECGERLRALILEALRPPPPRRKKTRPSRAARQRRILDLIMPEGFFDLREEDDDSDMDTAEDDWESASEAESDAARISERLARPAAWDSAWEPESDEETIWINGEWHYIDTPTAQDWLVSRVI